MIKKNPDSANPVRISRLDEVVFDAGYLLFAVIIGIVMLSRSTGTVGLLSGVMALVLAGGDAFHLIPRIIAVVSGETGRLRVFLGLGKLITSITMTLFYVLLWFVGLMIFPASVREWTVLVFILAGARIVLCLFRQNKWFDSEAPVRWAVLRNIPFLMLGIMTASFFGAYSSTAGPLRLMWLAVALSFAFYIPVVIGVRKNPKLGMLMLPKTCMYIWMLLMCSAL